MVIKGEYADDIEMKNAAREAASLKTHDVVILQNSEDFQFVNPGATNLPQLREIFVTNITTATGIPRPVLTSESAEINKACYSEDTETLTSNGWKKYWEVTKEDKIAQYNTKNNHIEWVRRLYMILMVK